MDGQAANLLIVDDNPKHLELMFEILKDENKYNLFKAGSGAEALRIIGQEDIQIVLLDIYMPEMDGYEVCRRIRQMIVAKPIQIVLISGIKSSSDLDELLDLGADDFIRKPIAPLELFARTKAALIRFKNQQKQLEEAQSETSSPEQDHELDSLIAENRSLRQNYEQARRLNLELEETNKELEKLASLDILSGLLNRRTLFQRLEVEVERSLRLHLPLTGIMIDIDHFKRVNDNFGHACGDQVIKEMGRKLGSSLRKYDFAGRYGGEEFFVIFPNTTAQTALSISERFRKEIEKKTFTYAGERLSISVSIGVAQYRPGDSQEKWVVRADMAMYRAKQEGRNKVSLE